MRVAVLMAAATVLLSGCLAEPKWAPDADVTRFAYTHPGPPTVKLYTVIRHKGGEGGHSAIMISGSERIIFDPAGTWWHPQAPERNDVFFGITPWMEGFYVDYHARESWYVVEQTVVVTPEVAERLMADVRAYGAVPKANCGRAVSTVLRNTPGFENVEVNWFPKQIMEDFANVPGVTTRTILDDDPGYNGFMLQAGVKQKPAGVSPTFTRGDQ